MCRQHSIKAIWARPTEQRYRKFKRQLRSSIYAQAPALKYETAIWLQKKRPCLPIKWTYIFLPATKGLGAATNLYLLLSVKGFRGGYIG